MNAVRARLDGDRWHWQHGPIDIVADAHGEPSAVAAAHEAAWQRFQGVLAELVAELPLLRQPVGDGPCPLTGPIARRMWQACAPFGERFITPMAAVAGSVAEELITCYRQPGIARAWLNNGGDIALHLAPGESLSAGIVSDLDSFHFNSCLRPSLAGKAVISFQDPVRGVATSGWRGRSLSRGIADSVTVLAASASAADAAATMIANAVNTLDPSIERRPASSVRDDSDLGERLVTVNVPPLPPALVRRALDAGAACASVAQQRGLIHAALMVCQGQWVEVEPICLKSPAPDAGTAVSARPVVGTALA